MDKRPSCMKLYKDGSLKERVRIFKKFLEKCCLCPRKCGINRLKGETGYCRSGEKAAVSSFGPHFGEEPVISGIKGSGTVFFANCVMKCVYCQNYQISQNYTPGKQGENLSEIIFELQNAGCENLNLVSPTHYTSQIIESLEECCARGFSLPVVYNSGGYENPEIIKLLAGIVDIFMPDIKYHDDSLSIKYSDAPNYFKNAIESLVIMADQTGDFVFDENTKALRGILLRHLVIPGNTSDSKKILFEVKKAVSSKICLSLMSQYYPCNKASQYPQINRTLTKKEYDDVVAFSMDLGFEHVFIQDVRESPHVLRPDFEKNIPFEF